MNDKDKAIDMLKRVIQRLQMPDVEVKGMDYGIEFGKTKSGKRIIPDPQKRTINISVKTEEK